MSLHLFPPKSTPLSSEAPEGKKPWPDYALPPGVICAMVKETLERWDRDWEKIVTCHYPDQNGSLSVWDNHFIGSPG